MIGGVGLTGILVQQGARGGLVGGTCPRVAGGGSGAGCVLVLSRPGAGSAPAGSRAVSRASVSLRIPPRQGRFLLVGTQVAQRIKNNPSRNWHLRFPDTPVTPPWGDLGPLCP